MKHLKGKVVREENTTAKKINKKRVGGRVWRGTNEEQDGDMTVRTGGGLQQAHSSTENNIHLQVLIM